MVSALISLLVVILVLVIVLRALPLVGVAV